ncbi:MAG: insulinase family protein [Candidatus Levybacteria bacterium]|nr:insulinase family protein [Candidatus Levybacteria bacterium]
MLTTSKLPNGIQLATYHLPNLKSIHLRISVKGGSLVENKINNGVAHFMEHMLVQGIPSFPTVAEFSRFIEGLAGNYGAYTKNLMVSFYITVPSTHLEEAIKIASETFFGPLFVEEAIEKERQAVFEEIKQKMDSHWYKISDFFTKTRFIDGHPLTLDGGGSLETIKNLKREDLIDYWKRYFHPSNTYLLVSGNFQEKRLEQLLKKYFSNHKNGKSFAGFPNMNGKDFTKRQVAIRSDFSLKICYLDLAFPSMGLFDDLQLRLKQNLALVIFGQLRNSRLFKLLRYDRGLVYDVGAGASQYPGLGYGYISSQVSPENLEEVVRLIMQEFASFVHHGPTDEELSFAKNYLTNQWLMTFDHPSSITGWVEDHLLWEESMRMPEDYATLLRGLTSQDLTRMMQKHWDFSKLNLILQGPIHNTRNNDKKYTSLMSVL